jgi:hypothetical protein
MEASAEVGCEEQRVKFTTGKGIELTSELSRERSACRLNGYLPEGAKTRDKGLKAEEG